MNFVFPQLCVRVKKSKAICTTGVILARRKKAVFPSKFLTSEHLKNLLIPAAAGVVCIAAFPPLDFGFLAWLALLPLLYIVFQVSPRRAFWAGFSFGLPLHLYLNLYLAEVLLPYLPGWLGLTALAAIVIYTSLFNALFAWSASLVKRFAPPLFTITAIPALWLVMEYMRSIGFMAYNNGYLGYTQWGYPFILNLTATYGYWGLPFIMLLFQTLICHYIMEPSMKKAAGRAAALLALLAAVGLALPEFSRVEEAGRKPLDILLIQGNSAAGDVLLQAGKEDILQDYLELTMEAASLSSGTELIVWPETVVDLSYTNSPEHRKAMSEAAVELEAAFLYGARVRTPDHLYNSIALLQPGKEEVPMYHKHRLVPFVEYFPYDKLLNQILQLDLLLGSYTAGEEITIFNLDGLPLAGVICFESYFGDHTRLFAAGNSRHLFILTNDAWFGDTIGLEQHAQVAAIRAAESGIGVTQAANSGITISFDYRGRELFRSEKSVRDYFAVSLDLKKRATIYARFGDYFPVFWTLYLLAGIFYYNFYLRKRNLSSPGPGKPEL